MHYCCTSAQQFLLLGAEITPTDYSRCQTLLAIKSVTLKLSMIKMSYLYRSDALVPQGKANVEKDQW